jgi:RNA-directed DNA polymerase
MSPYKKEIKFDLELYKKLLQAYSRCIRNKPKVKKTSFHFYHESNIYNLTRSLQYKTYKPWKSNIFVVKNPKPREVIAAHMRDRVVHHFLYDYMNSHWEKRFSKNSYACRKGKGPLQAVSDLQKFLRGYYRSPRAPLYYLKVDIQSFFASIDLDVLESIVRKQMPNNFYFDLFKTILWHRPTDEGSYQLKSLRSEWKHIPDYKSLFKAPKNRGLPIGNLTSQFFANIYLNELDQFIAHHLQKKGIVFWQRYVDDVLLISPDQRLLRDCIGLVQEFLVTKLNITLNFKKTNLQPVSAGIDHLGYFIKPVYALVRQRVVRSYRKKFNEFAKMNNPDHNAVIASLNSYFGYFRNADSERLGRSCAKDFAANKEKFPRIALGAKFDKLVLIPDSEKLLREKELDAALKQQFAEHLDALNVGNKMREKYLRNWRTIGDLLVLSKKERVLVAT